MDDGDDEALGRGLISGLKLPFDVVVLMMSYSDGTRYLGESEPAFRWDRWRDMGQDAYSSGFVLWGWVERLTLIKALGIIPNRQIYIYIYI